MTVCRNEAPLEDDMPATLCGCIRPAVDAPSQADIRHADSSRVKSLSDLRKPG